MQSDRDQVFAQPRDAVDFSFNETVAQVFPDMVRRSVPGYDAQLATLGVIAAHYGQPHTAIYDLGCSLGAASLSIARQPLPKGVHIVAVDNAPAMLQRARLVWQTSAPADAPPIVFKQADARAVLVEKASVVVLNYTLQFLPLAERLPLLKRIADGLCSGGALLLAEKITLPGAAQELMTQLHLDYKRANGYSEMEIAQKRTALENVLRPEPLATHQERLQEAGFRTVVPWFQCLNFASLLAIR